MIEADLFHYTNLSSLNSMLSFTGDDSTLNLRFCYLPMMNDPSETKLAMDIFNKSLKKKFNLTTEDFEKHSFDLETALRGLKNSGYSLCLCKNRDDLALWCSYTKLGQGAAIGFDEYELIDSIRKYIKDKIEKEIHSEFQHGKYTEKEKNEKIETLNNNLSEIYNCVEFYDVIYDDFEKQKIMDDLVAHLCEEKIITLKNNKLYINGDDFSALISRLVEPTIKFKPKSYEYEKEKRLVIDVYKLKGILLDNEICNHNKILPFHNFSNMYGISLYVDVTLSTKRIIREIILDSMVRLENKFVIKKMIYTGDVSFSKIDRY